MPAAKKIAFWLMKGGVGKSTRCLETAEMLYTKGYRVAVIEFDPQKDISKRVFRRKTVLERNGIQITNKEMEGLDDEGLFISQADFPEFYERMGERVRDPNNIYSALDPAIRGRGQQYGPKLIQVSDNDLGADNHNPRGPGLWLLPGHINIQKFDNKVVAAYESLGGLAESSLFGYDRLCSLMQDRYHLDYILVDLPPTSSPGIGHILCCSDGVVLPCECDGCSWEAIKDSIDKLKEFKDEYERLRTTSTSASTPHWLQPSSVKVLGTLQSNFNKEEGVYEQYIPSQYAWWIRKIDAEMRDALPGLRQKGLVYDNQRYIAAGVDVNCLCLSRTHNFSSLDGLSQKAGKAVAFLTPEDIVDRNGKRIPLPGKKRKTNYFIRSNPHHRVKEFHGILEKATLRIISIVDPDAGLAQWAAWAKAEAEAEAAAERAARAAATAADAATTETGARPKAKAAGEAAAKAAARARAVANSDYPLEQLGPIPDHRTSVAPPAQKKKRKLAQQAHRDTSDTATDD